MLNLPIESILKSRPLGTLPFVRKGLPSLVAVNTNPGRFLGGHRAPIQNIVRWWNYYLRMGSVTSSFDWTIITLRLMTRWPCPKWFIAGTDLLRRGILNASVIVSIDDPVWPAKLNTVRTGRGLSQTICENFHVSCKNCTLVNQPTWTPIYCKFMQTKKKYFGSVVKHAIQENLRTLLAFQLSLTRKVTAQVHV